MQPSSGNSSPPTSHKAPVPELGADETDIGPRLVRKQAYFRFSDPSLIGELSSLKSSSPSVVVATGSSPLISFKPKLARSPAPPTPCSGPRYHIGAVASLAIDGGLTADQLERIGAGTAGVVWGQANHFHRGALSTPKHRVQYQPVTLFRGLQAPDQPCRLQLHRVSNLTAVDLACDGRERSRRQPHHSVTSRASLAFTSSARLYQRHSGVLGTSGCGAPVVAPATTATHLRGSLPVQLTRVGGITLPGHQSPSQADIISSSPGAARSPSLGDSSDFQLQSNSASPTATASTSFFSCSPAGLQAPPVARAETSGEIVRLGPGATITHVAVPNGGTASTYNTVSSIIRMHLSPQPYMGSEAAPANAQFEAGRAASWSESGRFKGGSSCHPTGGFPAPTTSTRNDSLPTTNSPRQAESVGDPSPVLSTHESSGLIPRRRHPLSSTPISLVMLRSKEIKSVSPPAAQVARTVRHLRRIRHMFGDSLGYSGTSASTGALTSHTTNDEDISMMTPAHRDYCSYCLAPLNSPTADKPLPSPGDGSRSISEGVTPRHRPVHQPSSVEDTVGSRSVGLGRRPASLESHCLGGCLSPRRGRTSLPVRFEMRGEGKMSDDTCYTAWEKSCLFVSPWGNLAVTRGGTDRFASSSRREHPDLPPCHIHVTNISENWIGWKTPDQLPSSPGLAGSADDGIDSSQLIVGLLRIPDQPRLLSCQLCFDRNSLESHPLHLWVPMPPMLSSAAALAMSVADSQPQKVAATTETGITSEARGIFSGRSSSLGVAGPPGGSPLVRAVGTAAALIGMALPETPAFRSESNYSSAPANVELSKRRMYSEPSYLQAPSSKSPSRIQLVLSRMRRMAAPATANNSSASPSSQESTSRPRSRLKKAIGGSSDYYYSTASVSITTPPSSVVLDYHELSGEAMSAVAVSSASTTAGATPTSVSCPATVETLPEMLVDTSAPASLQQQQKVLQPTCLTVSLPRLTDGETSYPGQIYTDLPLRAYSDTPFQHLNLGGRVYQPTDRPAGDPGSNPAGGNLPTGQLLCRGHLQHCESLDVASLPPQSASQQQLEPRGSLPSEAIGSHRFAVDQHHRSFTPLPSPTIGPLPLHKCPRSTVSPFVPFIVELCVTLVEHFGLNCVGIYRLSGSKVAHDFIFTELGKNLADIDVNSDKWNDIHAVCGTLKTFLRNLPDTLLPKVMYWDFLAACRLRQRDRRLLSIQRLLGIMECYPHHPEYRAHRATLRYLATHLARVSARQSVNKMTTYNLALVFAPNLIQPLDDRPELLMSDSKYKILLLETVIKYHSWIFSPDLGLESGCSIPSDSTEDLSSGGGVSGGDPTMTEAVDQLANQKSDQSDSPDLDKLATSAYDVVQPGRLEGNVQPLVFELLYAAASLPPPPSDTDLETAEEPGPESDRPSAIASSLASCPRVRQTSIPCSTGAERLLVVAGDEVTAKDVDGKSDSRSTVSSSQPLLLQLGTKMDSLRHLSQGCIDQYISEARQLGERVARGRRDLESTVAQRLLAEQRLQQVRCETANPGKLSSARSSQPTGSSSSSSSKPIESSPSPLVLASSQHPGSMVIGQKQRQQVPVHQQALSDRSSDNDDTGGFFTPEHVSTTVSSAHQSPSPSPLLLDHSQQQEQQHEGEERQHEAATTGESVHSSK